MTALPLPALAAASRGARVARLLAFALLAGLVTAGCGAAGSHGSPTIAPLGGAAAAATVQSIAITPADATASIGGAMVSFSASLPDGTKPSVVWQVNGVAGGDASVGTISASGQYLSPAVMPSSSVTVTAVSATDGTQSGSATVSLTTAPPVTVVVSPSSSNVTAGAGTQIFVVSVSGTSDTAVKWQVNGVVGGDATVGTISTDGLYAAPATPPAQPTVTVTAVSVADPTQSASATVLVSSAEQAVTVSVAPTTANVTAGGTKVFTAAVVNGTSAAVTWQVNGVTGGNSASGTISAAGVYQAPVSVPSPAAVTITAVSVADPSRFANATVTIAAPVAVSISPSIVSVPVGSGRQQFSATVTNGASRSVTWQVGGATNGNAAVGTISAAGFYAAPATIPSPSTVTVTAVSVDDPTKSASARLTVVAAAAPPTISGTPSTTATVGHAYSFQPTASGGSGAALKFAIANQPSWATFNAATGMLSGTPASGAIGTYANISISVSDGTNTATLPAFTITVGAAASGSATVTWTAPTTQTDGTPLANLAGFRIYYGPSSGNYPTVITVANPSISTYVVSNLQSGTYYFVATAYDTNGDESVYSDQGTKTIP